jgi:ATP-binding protein involved in chromosome partitioning
MSMGMMIPEDQAIVWRGPMLMKALQQLLTDVDWGDQDIFIIDLPPGTGDIHITLAQKVELAGAIVVSTPQDIALIDAKKAISLFKKTNTKILGLIENMSYFRCTSCGEKHEIFSNGGIPERLGQDNVKILGEIPLIQEIRECSDLGIPFASKAGEGKTIFDEISAKILRAI